MKKGCFFSLITIFTIIVMLGIYLYRMHKDDIKNFGKEKLLGIVTNNLNDEIYKLKKTVYKDSLKSLMVKEIALVKKAKLENFDELGRILERIKIYSKDMKIDSTEYAKIKFMVKENEESAKIGN